MIPIKFCGIAKKIFSKRMILVSIGFGETCDGYFVTADVVVSILQGILSYRYFETVDVLE